jgi:hypothetical protein
VKAGDLVQWTHPEYQGFGIVLEVIRQPNQFGTGEAVILWPPSDYEPAGHMGVYPARHQYMETISEGW